MQINAQGEIAGAVLAPGELQKAIAWRGAHWHDLPSDGGRSWGSGINAHGDVAGTLIQGTTPNPVVWPRDGGRFTVALPDAST